jgi:hypothetical protein
MKTGHYGVRLSEIQGIRPKTTQSRYQPLDDVQQQIPLEIHLAFDRFILDIKDYPLHTSIEILAKKVFNSNAFWWISDGKQLNCQTLKKNARYNFSIISYAFTKNIAILEKVPPSHDYYDLNIDSNEPMLCFCVYNQSESPIGVLQLIRDNDYIFGLKELDYVKMFQYKFSRIFKFVFPDIHFKNFLPKLSEEGELSDTVYHIQSFFYLILISFYLKIKN